MAFSAPFSRTFRPVFGPGLSTGAVSWWLSGGVAAANCIAAYQPKGAADLAASYTNLAQPGTYDLQAASAPAFDTAVGWTFNGSANYLRTGATLLAGIKPDTTSQSWSMICRFASATAADGEVAGIADPKGSFYLKPYRTGTNKEGYANGAVKIGNTPQWATGVIAFGGTVAYKDGVALSGTINNAGSPGAFTWALLVGCRNNGGGASYFYGGVIIALAIYNAVLTAPQVAAITAAMNLL